MKIKRQYVGSTKTNVLINQVGWGGGCWMVGSQREVEEQTNGETFVEEYHATLKTNTFLERLTRKHCESD